MLLLAPVKFLVRSSSNFFLLVTVKQQTAHRGLLFFFQNPQKFKQTCYPKTWRWYPMKRILIVEDEPEIGEFCWLYPQQEGV